MVSGVNSNNFGTITRVGNTNSGRAVYEVKDPEGKPAGKITIPQQNCDVFEKSYTDMLDAAPKMEEFAKEAATPERQEKNRKINKWSRIIGAGAGLIASSLLVRKKISKYWLQALICVPATLAGLFGGAYAGTRLTTPNYAIKFTKAMQNISKIDVQPYEG